MHKLVLALAGAATLLVAAPAGAATKPCPPVKNTLAKDSHGYGRVWHANGSLYACTTVYGHRPRARRMGPYSPGVGRRVAFDGVNVAWTTPLVRNGQRSDRVWAGSADTGKRWLEGKRLIPASGAAAEREARIKRLIVEDRSIAWVTRGGDVVLALQFPESEPVAIGELPAPLKADGKRLLVGSFGTGVAAAIAREIEIEQLAGDGDECGGTNEYALTFRTVAHAPAIGARWFGGWVSTNC